METSNVFVHPSRAVSIFMSVQENVLVSDDGMAMLADFGLSTAMDKAASDATTTVNIRNQSTVPFCAPELLLDQAAAVDAAGQTRRRSKTSETDIYAFGMLILQVTCFL